MKRNSYLKSAGVFSIAQSKDEYLRLREFSRVLHKKLAYAEDTATLELIAHFAMAALRLLRLDGRGMGQVPYTTVRGVADALYLAWVQRQPIRFLSLASPAIDVSSRRIFEKKQYLLPPRVLVALKDAVADMPLWTYELLLADYDLRFSGHEDMPLWEENLRVLEAQSGFSAGRLSAVFPKHVFNEFRAEVVQTHGEHIDHRVHTLSENPILRLFFGATRERNTFQAFLYASCGLWLERERPGSILMDLQSKIYPCEQPFFQVARTSPLALIRVPGRVRA